MIDRISIEITNRCAKACSFCYNRSAPGGETRWSADEVVEFAADCARHGVKAVSLGGGEPLQHPGIFEMLARLRGLMFRSITTNGLLLESHLDPLVASAPDKVHVSIHFPDRDPEVERVIRQVRGLADRGLRSGINLLVRRSGIAAASQAARRIWESGIANDRIVYLPMRGHDTPEPREIAEVAGGLRFQSMSCLGGCARSERFCSVGWDRTVAWCSYTTMRRPLRALSHAALMESLDGLGLAFCGGPDAA